MLPQARVREEFCASASAGLKVVLQTDITILSHAAKHGKCVDVGAVLEQSSRSCHVECDQNSLSNRNDVNISVNLDAFAIVAGQNNTSSAQFHFSTPSVYCWETDACC
jgi:hypothetical protein